MAFSINEFKSVVASNNGFLKDNKFVVGIARPRGLPSNLYNDTSSSSNDALRMLEFYAESVSVPGISLQTSEVRRQGIGNLEKMPWGAAVTDADISFRIDKKSKTWNFFYTWMSTIYDFNMSESPNHPTTLFELGYKNDYSTTISLFVFDDNGNLVIEIDLIDAFPLSISDMSLNWGSANIIKLNVKFNYKSWNIRTNISKADLTISDQLNNSRLKHETPTFALSPNTNKANSAQRASIVQRVNSN